MNRIYEAIKQQMLDIGVEEDDIESFMDEKKFTISFGDMDVLENRNNNPQMVKRKGISISYENKNKDVMSGIVAEL